MIKKALSIIKVSIQSTKVKQYYILIIPDIL